MIETKRTAGSEGDQPMRIMKPTAANLTRRAGVAARGNAGIAMFPIRLAAVAGLAAAVVLFVNAAKRAGLIPISIPRPYQRSRIGWHRPE